MNNNCILVIDDNTSDLGLIERAIKSCSSDSKLVLMDNGQESIAYLMGEGEYSDRDQYPYPSMIITDLNMPMIDGFDILEHMKINPSWEVIPTIVLSSSQDQDDIQTAYMLGASAYHVKPHDFFVFEKNIRAMVEYWSLVEHPMTELSGQHIYTNSENKFGQRFSKPDRNEQVRIDQKKN